MNTVAGAILPGQWAVTHQTDPLYCVYTQPGIISATDQPSTKSSQNERSSLIQQKPILSHVVNACVY